MIEGGKWRPLVCFVFWIAGITHESRALADVDYLGAVKPLLRERCYACHGGLKQKGGLRLDTVAMMRKGGESGDALAMRKNGPPLLLERISSKDPEEYMPPQHEGERFTATQVQTLRAWIESGAEAPAGEKPEADPREHWAFRARRRPAVAVISPGEWGRNPVDALLAKGHAQRGVKPQPEAAPEVLLRRLFLDLVGVPPTLQDLKQVEGVPVEEWYGSMVERLLADPRYGQRWGRHWMDVWRYSDWWGLGSQLRNSQKHMWHWRDWIIDSLNEDIPYDEMVRLMLAADEIAPEDPQKLRATGFLARNWFLFNRNTWMEDTVEHVGKGLLGLTFNCAKCHDHKYDPISQVDYYRLRAFFEPYHVRLDVVPGGSNLEVDGMPRVYDGALDAPTFRFVRGEESRPDKSVAIVPGLPAILAPGSLKITPVSVPSAAFEPERQPWVLDAHVASARRAVAAAEEQLSKAMQKLSAAEQSADSPAVPAKALLEARAECDAAHGAARQAGAELESVDLRARAMRALWAGMPEESALRAAAVRAEREAGVAKQRRLVADVALRLLRAPADKKAGVEKEVKAAAEALDKELKKLDAPVEAGAGFARLYGAKWTPTRFLSSGKDDPDVSFPRMSTGRRKALAEWITDPGNPLTARVAVNHIWSRHMGAPLAASMFEFGRKGGEPSQPELLDWLACELVDSGWSMKHVHRIVVNSAAYRLSSGVAGADKALAADSENALWWRRTPVRLEAEVVRDSMIALAGELDSSLGGAPVPASGQSDSKRRSVYFYHSNNERNLLLTTFDEAAVKECYRRDESIVPQQALALSNSRLVREMAGRISSLLSAGSPELSDEQEDAFVRRAYAYVLGIKAGAGEVAACRRAMGAWRNEASAPGAEREAVVRGNLVWALINHNDFVTLR